MGLVAWTTWIVFRELSVAKEVEDTEDMRLPRFTVLNAGQLESMLFGNVRNPPDVVKVSNVVNPLKVDVILGHELAMNVSDTFLREEQPPKRFSKL